MPRQEDVDVIPAFDGVDECRDCGDDLCFLKRGPRFDDVRRRLLVVINGTEEDPVFFGSQSSDHGTLVKKAIR